MSRTTASGGRLGTVPAQAPEAERNAGPSDPGVAGIAYMTLARQRTSASRTAAVETHVEQIAPGRRGRTQECRHPGPHPPYPNSPSRVAGGVRYLFTAALMAASEGFRPVQNSNEAAP